MITPFPIYLSFLVEKFENSDIVNTNPMINKQKSSKIIKNT